MVLEQRARSAVRCAQQWDQALKTAHLAALKKQLANKDTDAALKAELKRIIEEVQKELEALKRAAPAQS